MVDAYRALMGRWRVRPECKASCMQVGGLGVPGGLGEACGVQGLMHACM